MHLPALIAAHSDDELRDALERIRDGGPYSAATVKLIRNLHVYRFADVRVHERRRESGAIVVDIVSARLTERGAALLDALEG